MAAGTPQSDAPTTLRRNLPNWLTALRVGLSVVFFALLTPWTYTRSPAAVGWRGGAEWGGGIGAVDWWLLSAAAVFLLAAVTDALDGYLARRWNATSALGRIMDPFADKLLVVGAFVFLAGPGFLAQWTERAAGPGSAEGAREALRVVRLQVSGVEPWMVAVILGRELLVTSIRGVLESQGVRFASSLSGKLKMILQSITVPVILVLLATVDVRSPADEGYWVRADNTPIWGGWAELAIDLLVWVTVLVTVWSGLPYVTRALHALREGNRGREWGAGR